MEIVRVKWRDAHSECESWMLVEDIDPDPRVIESVGFLVPDAKADHVVLAQSHDDLIHVDSVLAIPVAMVVSMQVLC